MGVAGAVGTFEKETVFSGEKWGETCEVLTYLYACIASDSSGGS